MIGVAAALAEGLRHDWRAEARPSQLPPAGDWFGWLVLAGRGFGKTLTGAQTVREEVEAGRSGRIALVGPTAADVRDVMVEGKTGILAVSPPSTRPVYEKSLRRLTWPSGAVAFCYSAEEAERLRGPQHDFAWCDELAAWLNARDVWDQLNFGMRLGRRPRVVVTTTPKPTKLVRELRARPDFVVTGGSTEENAANLPASYLQTMRDRYGGTRLGRQELDAEILEDTPGALWTRERIEALRAAAAPALVRIVIAVDPAVSTTSESDETGIIAAGLGADGHGYVLEDASGRYAPTEWAARAVGLYHRLGADRIVAEVNQGGQMVESTIRVVDARVSYKGVHASRGKLVRAEPASALYEQGKVHHVGALPTLEDQLCTYAPGTAKSPDRLDALVWALTELMLGNGFGLVEFYRREAEEEASGTYRPTTAERHAMLWHMPDGTAREPQSVRLRIPLGMTVQTLSGAPVIVEADGTALLSEIDASPLKLAGFEEVGGAADG